MNIKTCPKFKKKKNRNCNDLTLQVLQYTSTLIAFFLSWFPPPPYPIIFSFLILRKHLWVIRTSLVSEGPWLEWTEWLITCGQLGWLGVTEGDFYEILYRFFSPGTFCFIDAWRNYVRNSVYVSSETLINLSILISVRDWNYSPENSIAQNLSSVNEIFPPKVLNL